MRALLLKWLTTKIGVAVAAAVAATAVGLATWGLASRQKPDEEPSGGGAGAKPPPRDPHRNRYAEDAEFKQFVAFMGDRAATRARAALKAEQTHTRETDAEIEKVARDMRDREVARIDANWSGPASHFRGAQWDGKGKVWTGIDPAFKVRADSHVGVLAEVAAEILDCRVVPGGVVVDGIEVPVRFDPTSPPGEQGSFNVGKGRVDASGKPLDCTIGLGPELLRDFSGSGQLAVAVHELLHARRFAGRVQRFRRRYANDPAMKDHTPTELDEKAFKAAVREHNERHDYTTGSLVERLGKYAEYAAEEVSVQDEAQFLTRYFLNGLGKAYDAWSAEYTRGWNEFHTLCLSMIDRARAGGPEAAAVEAELREIEKGFALKTAQSRSALPPGAGKPTRQAVFDHALRTKPVFGGVVLGNRTDKDSVRLREAKFAFDRGRPYLDLLVEGPGGPQRCRYDPASATELWAAYHVLRPTPRMREACQLDGAESGLVSCEVDPLGIEGRFAIHPALAQNYFGLMAQRLDLLVAAGAPGLFDHADFTRYSMQWYDEAARLTVRDGRLVVEAAAGPPGVLLRVRFWGHEKTPGWLARSKAVKVGEVVPGAGALDTQRREDLIGVEVNRRVWERLAYGPPKDPADTGPVTREQFLKVHEEAAEEVLAELGGNLPVDSGPVIARGYDVDLSIPAIDRFAKTLAVLRWVADTPGVGLPALPAAVAPVWMAVPPRASIVDLAGHLRAAAPPPPAPWREDPPEPGVTYDRELWYAVYANGSKRGYRHDTWRSARPEGTTVEVFERHIKMGLAAARGAAVTFRRTFGSTYEAGLGRPFLVGYANGLHLSTESPLRLVARRDPNAAAGDPKTFTLTFTGDGEATTDRVTPPLAGYDAVVRSLGDKPMKPGEQRTEVMVLDPNSPSLKQWNVTLRARGAESTEVLGKEAELLRVDATASALPFGEKREDTLWVDTRGTVVKEVTGLPVAPKPLGLPDPNAPPAKEPTGPQSQYTYYLTTREAALAPSKERVPEFPRGVAYHKVDRPPDNPAPIDRFRLRVHLTAGVAGTPFADGPGQTVTRVDGKTFDVELRTPSPAPPGVAGPPADEYRRPTDFIQSTDPLLAGVAGLVQPGSDDHVRVALDLEWSVYRMVVKNFKHPYLSAAETVRVREGDCSEHAALLVGLARARGIPARLATGLNYFRPMQAFVGHQWAEVWLNGAWWPLDGTLGMGGIDATHLKTDDSPGRFPDDDAPNLAALGKAGIARVEVLGVGYRPAGVPAPRPVSATPFGGPNAGGPGVQPIEPPRRDEPKEPEKVKEPTTRPKSGPLPSPADGAKRPFPVPKGLDLPDRIEPGSPPPRPDRPAPPPVPFRQPLPDGKAVVDGKGEAGGRDPLRPGEVDSWRRTAFRLGRSLGEWVLVQEMYGPESRPARDHRDASESAARTLAVTLPHPTPGPGLSELSPLNTVRYLTRVAEPALAAALRRSHGAEVEASFLFATRARTLLLLYPILTEAERLGRADELEKLGATTRLGAEPWAAFVRAVRQGESVTAVGQNFGAMMDALSGGSR